MAKIVLKDYQEEAVKYALKKGEKPVWKVSIVALVVTALFAIYFFVPPVL